MEKESKADLLPIQAGKEDLRLPLLEDPLPEKRLCGHDLTAHLFVLRKAADKVKDQSAVLFLCGAESQIFHSGLLSSVPFLP